MGVSVLKSDCALHNASAVLQRREGFTYAFRPAYLFSDYGASPDAHF